MSRKKTKSTKTRTTVPAIETPVAEQCEWIARDADLRILGRIQASTEDEALAAAKEQFDGAETVEPTLADQDSGVQAPAQEDGTADQPAADAPVEQATPDTPAEPVALPAAEPQAKTETPATEAPVDATHTTDGDGTPATANQPAEAPAKKKRTRTAKPATDKKLSALDAAAKVLAETGTAMSCQELILAMAEKGYWSSPNGKTPAATLYAAMLWETQTKGSSSRFVKADRGKFALRPVE